MKKSFLSIVVWSVYRLLMSSMYMKIYMFMPNVVLQNAPFLTMEFQIKFRHTLHGQKYVDTQTLHPFVIVEHAFPFICCSNSLHCSKSIGEVQHWLEVDVPVHPKMLDGIEFRTLCGLVKLFHTKPGNLFMDHFFFVHGGMVILKPQNWKHTQKYVGVHILLAT